MRAWLRRSLPIVLGLAGALGVVAILPDAAEAEGYAQTLNINIAGHPKPDASLTVRVTTAFGINAAEDGWRLYLYGPDFTITEPKRILYLPDEVHNGTVAVFHSVQFHGPGRYALAAVVTDDEGFIWNGAEYFDVE